MNRKEITNFLGNLLKREKFSGLGKYWASEVSIDYGTTDVKRVDYMRFEPAGVIGISGIEKGVFTCYEVKSCKADFKSGFGRNFVGEKNYFVMPMSTYKEVIHDIPHNVGVIAPIPKYADKHVEFENPTELSADTDWKLCVIKQSVPQLRKRSMTELLFCMLRSGNDIQQDTSDDLISKKAVMSHIESEYRQWGQDYDTEQILADIEDFPAAYDAYKKGGLTWIG